MSIFGIIFLSIWGVLMLSIIIGFVGILIHNHNMRNKGKKDE